jgi:hypothetical protein
MTEAEGIVVRALLASQPIAERERIERTGLPPRTYFSVKQRLLNDGYLTERYIPDLGWVGFPILTFVIVQPYSENFQKLLDAWKGDASNIFLWSGQERLVGVFAHINRGAAKDFMKQTETERGASMGMDLTVDARDPSLPVYFDFEGAWSMLIGASGTLSYPQPLVSAHSPPSRGSHGSELSAARGLVTRPIASTTAVPPRRFGTFFLSRTQRRVLNHGLVSHRVFLDLTKAAAISGIERIIFVKGKLVEGCTPEGLFRLLAGECRVAPFLFAVDHDQILFAGLSPRPAGNPSREVSSRRSVSALMKDSLTGIQVMREPTQDLSLQVNHRYDRLFHDPDL